MEPIESSETSAYNNILTPGTYPKEKKLRAVKLFPLYGTDVECNYINNPEFSC